MNLFSGLFGKPDPAITSPELSEKLQAPGKPYLLDVRQPQEYAEAHIAGAKLIPLADLSKRMKELPRNREIVLICATGNRSGTATRMLLSAGFNAVNLRGGMFGWRRASLPVKKGNTP